MADKQQVRRGGPGRILRELFRLWGLYARMDLGWLMQDLTSVVIVVLSEALQNLSSMAGVLLLAIRFGGVGGLKADEVLFMLGFYQLADGLGWMLFGNYNIIHLSRRIGRGQVDHMLIQPRPLWMQLVTEGFMPFSGCHGFLIGLTLTVIAVRRLGIGLSPAWFGLLGFYLVIHILLQLSQCVLYGSAAFWQPVSCEEISSMVIDLNTQLGKFPLFGLPQWLLGIFHTVLPIGLMGYLPALSLLGMLDKAPAITLPFVVCGLFVTAAVVFFQKGLKHYEQYSCNRYKEMGHRC
jgi:ABC-2 type transport system permease protein